MSMSTRIDDLPDVYENDVPTEPQYDEQVIERQPSESNIKMNVKKKVHFDDNITVMNGNDGIWNMIKREVSEENLLILAILFLSSISVLNNQLRKIPILKSISSDFVINIIKVSVIFVGYILFKNFVLPRIKL